MKTNKIFLPVIFQFLFFTAFSQNFPDSYFESRCGRLEYGFSLPKNYDSEKVYPLVMYLHGWSNNYSVYLNWYSDEIQDKHPCFVYTPKTPTSWADWSGWSDHLTEPMKAAIHVLDSLAEVFSVDINRIYVYGISMGGEGTFDLLHKFPEKFAAAMSVCGGGKPEWAENVSKTPIWMFHGSVDDINPPKLTEDVYNKMLRIGAKQMRYKCYEGYGHDIWNIAESEPAWNDWMFSFSKNDLIYPKPAGDISLKLQKGNDGKYHLLWNDVRNPENKGDKIWYYKIYNSAGVIGTTEFNQTTFTLSSEIKEESFYVKAVNYYFQESAPSNKVSK